MILLGVFPQKAVAFSELCCIFAAGFVHAYDFDCFYYNFIRFDV